MDEGSERDEAEGDDEDLEEEEEVESDPPHKKIRSDYQPRKPSDNGDTDGLSTLPSHVKDSPDSPIKQLVLFLQRILALFKDTLESACFTQMVFMVSLVVASD